MRRITLFKGLFGAFVLSLTALFSQAADERMPGTAPEFENHLVTYSPWAGEWSSMRPGSGGKLEVVFRHAGSGVFEGEITICQTSYVTCTGPVSNLKVLSSERLKFNSTSGAAYDLRLKKKGRRLQGTSSNTIGGGSYMFNIRLEARE